MIHQWRRRSYPPLDRGRELGALELQRTGFSGHLHVIVQRLLLHCAPARSIAKRRQRREFRDESPCMRRAHTPGLGKTYPRAGRRPRRRAQAPSPGTPRPSPPAPGGSAAAAAAPRFPCLCSPPSFRCMPGLMRSACRLSLAACATQSCRAHFADSSAVRVQKEKVEKINYNSLRKIISFGGRDGEARWA
jgi:hypothetical protein